MTNLLEKAGASFVRAFVAALIILAPGVLSAPNLNQAKLLGVAALIASLTAGLKALQVFAPRITFGGILGQPAGAWADSFVRAFVGSLLVLLIGVAHAPDLHTARALGVAALVAALAAGLRALQGLTTKGEDPAPASGL
jgi:hypothetical protein